MTAPLRRNSRAELDRLLGEMIAHPAAEAEIAAEIDRIFAEERAVLVLDMSGFSRTTQRCGITAFLLMIHQMKTLAGPVVRENGGIVVKAEADNLYCLFPGAADAVAAARGIVAGLDSANLLLPEERRLHAKIGIGYGRILNIDEEDLYGNEVNLASKLGEDIAERRAILLTEAARAEAEAAGIATQAQTVSVSGLALTYHVLA